MLSLFFAVLILAISVLAPGYLIVAALADDRATALCLAPAVTVGFLAVTAVICSIVGTSASYYSLMIPVALISVGLFLALKFSRVVPDPMLSRLPSLLVFAVICIVLSSYVVVTTFDGPDCYFQGWDNVHHLAEIQTFVRGEDYYPISNFRYIAGDVSPTVDASYFYPSAWHMLAAMLVSLLGIPVAEAANAVNILSIAVVYPLGFFLCITSLGLSNKKAIPFCAVVCIGIPAFPWDMISYGPLYPNLLGLAFVPGSLAFIALLLRGDNVSFRTHPHAAILLGVPMFAALALTHPGALFSLGAIAAPLLIAAVAGKAKKICKGNGLLAWSAGALCLILICVIWYCCYKAPFLSATTSVDWPAISSLPRALFDAFTLGVTTHPSQIVIPILCLSGCFVLLKSKRNRWLVVSFAFVVLLYAVDAGTNFSIKHLLTGFWYTDYHRTGAMVGIVSGLIACVGLTSILKWIYKVIRVRGRCFADADGHMASRTVVCLGGTAILAVIVFAPSFKIGEDTVCQTAFGYEKQEISLMYDQQIIYYDVFSPGEESFCKSLRADLDDGNALIINDPQDGSLFAYSVLGLNVYYRGYNVPDAEEETEDSKLLRLHLDEYASNAAVRDAVARTGAKYVLQLDNGAEPSWEYRIQYNSASDVAEWSGIESISPETEGFTLIKSDEDMRLYKIG